MHRFYVPNIATSDVGRAGPEASNRAISLDGPVARQLKTVLRVVVGDRIRLFDGSGSEWEVEVDHVGKDGISTKLISAVEPVPDPSVKVTMLLGLARPERIELAIQKCTELGVVRFVPVISERVQGSAVGAPSAKRLDRWRRIAIEAAEQSGRATVPTVEMPAPIMDSVKKQLTLGPLLCMWEEVSARSISLGESLQEIRFPKTVTNPQSEPPVDLELGALIGPPGGLSDREAEAIQQAGGRLVTLGPRVLRSETAAIAVMSAILYEMGDLGASDTVSGR